MAITILKNNVPQGPFSRTQVAEKLHAGEFSIDDLAFVEGLIAWTPLRQVLAKVDENLTLTVPEFTSSAPSLPYSYAATMRPPKHLVYVGFWLRVAAYLIDGLILIIPIFCLIIPFLLLIGASSFWVNSQATSAAGSSSANAGLTLGILIFELIFFVLGTVATWLYFALLESGPSQATWGKRIMNIKVTNMVGGAD